MHQGAMYIEKSMKSQCGVGPPKNMVLRHMALESASLYHPEGPNSGRVSKINKGICQARLRTGIELKEL